MKYYGLSDIGKVRELNEDSFSCFPLSDDTVALIVCDGMGGANHGEVASALAVKKLKENFSLKYKEDYSPQSIKNMITSSINIANYAVFDKASSSSAFGGMGTTLCLAVVKGNEALIANIGDSRAYIVGEDVRLITRDHSFVMDLVLNGEITPEEAKTHPKKNIITRAIGAEETVDADYYVEQLKEGETLLICSDGLYGSVSEEDILLSLKKDIKTAAEELIEKANLGGGRDNISLVLYRV